MADPLSILGAVGSIVGIIDVLGRSITTIHALRKQWNDADFSLLNLVSQLTALMAALNKIKEWADLDLREPHLQLVMDLDSSVSCCRTLIEIIDAQLSGIQRSQMESLKYLVNSSLCWVAKAWTTFRR